MRLPADQVLVDDERIVVVAEARWQDCPGPTSRCTTPHNDSGRHDVPPAWMTAATEPCETCSPKPHPSGECQCVPCESPAYGHPAHAHCAACCGGSMIAEYSSACPVADHAEWAERQNPRSGCLACHDGRPIVTIEVECEGRLQEHSYAPGRTGLRCDGGCAGDSTAYATPGTVIYRLVASHPRVVPIQDRNQAQGLEQIVPSNTPGKWWLWSDFHIGRTLTLPPAATPGMWALIGTVL